MKQLKDPDKDVRFCAGEALSRFGPKAKRAVPALMELLGDPDEDYRSLAASTLGDIGSDAEDAVPLLIGCLNDESYCVSTSAFHALGQIGPSAKAAVPALIKELRQSGDLRPMFAAGALEGIGSEATDAIPSLRELSERDAGLIAYSAAAALRVIESEAAVKAGTGPRIRVPDGTPKSIVNAITDLYKGRQPGMLGGARPGNWPQVEYYDAMYRVAKFGNRAIPILIANINNPRLKFPVIQILADLQAKNAVPLLLERLELEDSPNDTFLIRALATITQHPKGYEFYRFYFDDRGRQQALIAYNAWWDSHKNKSD